MRCTECKGNAIKSEDFAVFDYGLLNFKPSNAKFLGFVNVKICKKCLKKYEEENTKQALSETGIKTGALVSYIALSLLAVAGIFGAFGDQLWIKIFSSLSLIANIGYFTSEIINVPKRKAAIKEKQKSFENEAESSFRNTSLLEFFPVLDNIKTETLFNAQNFDDFSDVSKLHEYIESSKSKEKIGLLPSEGSFRKYLSLQNFSEQYSTFFNTPAPDWIAKLYGTVLNKGANNNG